MYKQFVNKETGEILFISIKDKKAIKEYENSKEWEQAWNLVVN